MKTHSPSPFTPLVLRLAQILGGLRTAVAACGGRRMLGWDRRPDDPRIVPLIVPIWGRIGRLMARFDRLVARLAAGWQPHRAIPAAPGTAATPAQRVRVAGAKLPRGFGWLVQYTHGASAAESQLAALLADPGIADLIATAPSVGRVLRPLCWMLGVRLGPPLGPAVAVSTGQVWPRQANGRFRAKPAVASPQWPPGATHFSTRR